MAAFCFTFLMMVRYVIEVGGELPVSLRSAVHASDFDVERMRAEPLVTPESARLEIARLTDCERCPEHYGATRQNRQRGRGCIVERASTAWTEYFDSDPNRPHARRCTREIC